MNKAAHEHALARGLDLQKFNAFCVFARDNPGAVHFHLEARGTAEPRAVHTIARTRRYTLGGESIDRAAREYVYHLGAHKEVEGALGFTEPTDREEPTEVVLAALTGCINSVVSTSALQRGIVLDSLETHVRIGWGPQVFLHLDAPDGPTGLTDQFGDLQLTITVGGPALTEDDVAYLHESLKRSAVYNLLRLPHACAPEIVQK